jgi:probable HAF family extracellular repeat protein
VDPSDGDCSPGLGALLDRPVGGSRCFGRLVGMTRRAGFLVVCFFVHASLADAAPPNYAVTDLGTLGGTISEAYGINASGQVTGYASTTGDSVDLAFVYDGTMHDLGTLGGTSSEGLGINASGQSHGLRRPRAVGNAASMRFCTTARCTTSARSAEPTAWDMRHQRQRTDHGAILHERECRHSCISVRRHDARPGHARRDKQRRDWHQRQRTSHGALRLRQEAPITHFCTTAARCTISTR